MPKKMFKKIIIGFLAGIICGLFSAGGGLVLVPACIYFLNLDDKQARSTSIFAIMFMVITAALFYYKDNFINWQVGIKCAIGGIIGSIIGSYLLKKVSNKYLKIIFVIFLLYAAISTLVKK